MRRFALLAAALLPLLALASVYARKTTFPGKVCDPLDTARVHCWGPQEANAVADAIDAHEARLAALEARLSGGGTVAKPTLTSVVPSSGPVGTVVALTGTNLANQVSVTFGGVVGTVASSGSSTSMTATVPVGAVTGPVIVTTLAGTNASPPTFTVTTTGSTYAPTHYVDCSLSTGANDGSSAVNAWRTLALASAHTFAGDNVLAVKGGVTCNGHLTILGTGTSGHPIVVTSGNAAGYGPGVATLDAQNTGGSTVLTLPSTASYVVVDGLKIANTFAGESGIGGLTSYAFSVPEGGIAVGTQASPGVGGHNTIKNVEIQNVGYGLWVWNDNNTIGPANYIHDLRMIASAYGAVGLQIYSSGNRVTGNTFRRTRALTSGLDYAYDGGVLELYNDGGATIANNIIDHNWISGSEGVSESTGVVSNAWFFANVIEDHHGDTISLQTPGSETGYRFENNTVSLSSTAAAYGQVFWCASATSTNLIARKNIFSLPASGWTAVLTCAGITHDHNLYYKAGAAAGSWGWTLAGTELFANPLFASATDYHLQAASPAIDAGTTAYYPTDWSGLPVPSGAAVDIGAYEYQGAPVGGVAYSRIGSSAVTTTGATISWDVSPASPGRVEYGATVSYGLLSTNEPTAYAHHDQILAGLSPSTTYHYRVTDGAGHVSGDYTFTTAASGGGGGGTGGWSTGYYTTAYPNCAYSGGCPLSGVNWAAYTHVVNFYGYGNNPLALVNPSNSAAILAAGHARGVKIIFGTGQALASYPTTSGAQATWAADVATRLNTSFGGQYYDGVDIDWEGGPPDDQLQGLIRATRAAIGPNKLLTVAGSNDYWAKYKPVIDLIDMVQDMSYKVTTATTGMYSLVNIVDRFVSNGIPASKVSVGFGMSYGDSEADADTVAGDCAGKASFLHAQGFGIFTWGMQTSAAAAACETAILPYVPSH